MAKLSPMYLAVVYSHHGGRALLGCYDESIVIAGIASTRKKLLCCHKSILPKTEGSWAVLGGAVGTHGAHHRCEG